MKNIYSPFLKTGDAIEIIAPASACSKEEFEKALLWLKAQGFNAVYDKNILNPEFYLANTDKQRFKMLKSALYNKKTKAIWCLRGGYGCLRLVPDLMKLKTKAPAKFFIGLSDITILHHFLNTCWNWPTIHGPVLARTATENKRAEDYEELFGLLKGEKTQVSFKNLNPLNGAARKKTISIKARIYGGNLCTFCTLLGTELQPRLKDHFLFFEDSAERGYKVDRMLQQLKQAGVFNKCKGVFFGKFILSEESNGKSLVPYALEKFFENLKIPAFSGIESDHSEKQRPFLLNSPALFIQKTNGNSLDIKF